jgi:hypothetical protein
MNGLYGLKAFYSRLLAPVSKLAVRAKLSPDLFTWLGVVGGVLGGYGLAIGSSLLVLLGVLVRLAGANLDGVVARARGLESRRGFWVNELGDRLGDCDLHHDEYRPRYRPGRLPGVPEPDHLIRRSQGGEPQALPFSPIPISP